MAITYSQNQYWQQQVNYTIDVSLNDIEHSLTGFETIIYSNNSPDTLTFIWFHLWPNAYKNDKTAFSDQLLENGNTNFYFSSKEEKGYINRLDFKVNNTTAIVEDHPEHIDIVKIILPSPLYPGQKTTITTPFHVKLPYNFSRGGHDGESYQITQWYPKPAVYDKKGWHPMPYLDQGEFYSEYGHFEVNITVPKNYVVAATGILQNADEIKWLKDRNTYTWEPIRQKIKTSGGQIKTTYQLFPESDKEIKLLSYRQNDIHDFAWFADKRFIVNYDTCHLATGKVIDIYTYYTPAQKEIWKNSTQYAKDAIQHYSSLVGAYPYDVVSVVQGPASFGGGMEYPTITVLSPEKDSRSLEYTIAHEIGHNWFYGILGSNERDFPWMDEGMTTFYTNKYQQKKDPHDNQRTENGFLATLEVEKKDQPIQTGSADFNDINYGLIAYTKAANWIKYVEQKIGTTSFNNAMQSYFENWKFKHPYPTDFKNIIETASNTNLDSAFALLNSKGSLPETIKKGIAIQGPAGIVTGINETKKSAITLLPAIGINSYDKLMFGGVITNLRLPPNRFQFLIAPLYGIGSKKINAIGFTNYSFYPNGLFRKIDIGISGAKFTGDRFTDIDGNKTFLGFSKLVPGIRFSFSEKNARSTRTSYIQFKSFFIQEDGLRFYRDTIITGIDTTITNKYTTRTTKRTLNQVQFVIENNRVLYPYRGELKVDQGKDFIRLAVTGKYFFNYPKEGGLQVRLFAGKFIYSSGKSVTKEFATDRYHINMTGANGYEDYTYSDYFAGRNEFEGFASQQIMERDGAFKVRTDLLAEKVGKTDDWLVAANFSTTIPRSINPLSILPVNIPLKLFFDIGTYADSWKQGATSDRFLFDAGLHIPLIKETVNIYIPILYSNIYKEYIQSTIEKQGRFWKKISFSIDISNFSFKKIDRNLDF